jgi:hypothetical protein
MKYVLILIATILVSCSNEEVEIPYKDYKVLVGDTMKYSDKKVRYFGEEYNSFVNETGHTILRNKAHGRIFHDPECAKCVARHNDLIDQLKRVELEQQHTDSLLLRLLKENP